MTVRFIVALCALAALHVAAVSAEPRRFTVTDEIGLADFGNDEDPVRFSPDGAFFSILFTRGRFDTNRPESVLRIYRSADVSAFLRAKADAAAPEPVWSVERSSDRFGPIIARYQWLADSSGIAILERGPGGLKQLVLADVAAKRVELLSPPSVHVTGFDVRDRTHYVYSASEQRIVSLVDRNAASFVATGRSLLQLMYPADLYPEMRSAGSHSSVWFVDGGAPMQVTDPANGRPLTLFIDGTSALALSPDGASFVTVLPIAEVPLEWERLFLPPYSQSPQRVQAGPQDLDSLMPRRLVGRFVRIDPRKATIEPLVDAPTAVGGGWFSAGNVPPSWSRDGRSVILPGTFVRSTIGDAARACVAAVNIESRAVSCVDPLTPRSESGPAPGYRSITGARFLGSGRDRILVTFVTLASERREVEYLRKPGAEWVEAASSEREPVKFGVKVTQSFREAPLVVAHEIGSKPTRVLWDPNPQLKDIDLGEATVYRWTDKTGREWVGGLFKPPGHRPGERYPLVIQNHGFLETVFRPSGRFAAGFAARAMAAAGIVVVQVRDCPIRLTPDEADCNIRGYDALVEKLSAEGLVDPSRVGIIGFSRTCYYVMRAITSGNVRYAAASVTDGVMFDYMQYMAFVDLPGWVDEVKAVIGPAPFGGDLKLWEERSPLFSADKVTAPLLVNASFYSLLGMWGSYAALRHLGKPVELNILNSGFEHPFHNPAVRMASQGGTVDWFRFWLQGYEEPDPSKVAQYERWRKLREMQGPSGTMTEGARSPK